MDTSKWKWFVLKDIFYVKAGKYHYKDEYENGTTPYISATAVNNGVSERISLSPEFESGVITTEKVKCTAFYQPTPFCATSDVNIIKRKDGETINQYIGLFLSTIIDFNESFRWTYGRQCRVNDTENIRIKLPVTIDGVPDWQYMEDFVKKNIIPKLPYKAKNVWLKKYETKPFQDNKMQLDTEKWKWFKYDEIFDIKHGFYNKKPEDNPDGNIPFVGATDSNNGVTSHSDLETIETTTKTGDGNNAPLSEKIFEKCIAVTNNGSVGYAYYQEKPFTCTHDVNPLYLKDHEINPYIALFLCTLIEKERFRWAYGRKWRPIRMPSSRIKLPVTPEGTPDWQFMEDYIKSLPFSKNI